MQRVNIVVGRFQPFTAGHYICVKTANEKKNVPTVICMVNTPESKVDKRHPFTTNLIMDAYKDFFGNSVLIKDVITVKNANIVDIAKALRDKGYEAVSWTCGTDRYDDYSRMADKYRVPAELPDDFECIEVPRTDEDISATKARNCLLNNDKDGFFKLMPEGLEKSDDMFNNLKQQIETVYNKSESRLYKRNLVLEYKIKRLEKYFNKNYLQGDSMLIHNNKYSSLHDMHSLYNESKINTCHYVNEADNSWGEIFESIICEAYNNKGKVPADCKYISVIESKNIDPDTLYSNIYNSLKRYKMPKIRKLENVKNSVTPEWITLGLYKESGKTPNNTPKTDIIGGKYHISVKEGTGARLMSGAVNESIATIRAAIKSLNDPELNKEINELFNKLKSVGTRARLSSSKVTVGDIKKKYKNIGPGTDISDDERKVLAIEELKKEFNQFVAKINSDPNIREAIIREALTGAVKFGKDSDSCANYILTWHSDGTCKLYTIDEFYNEFGSHYKVKAAFKSSSVKNAKGDDLGRDIWLVLSIT